MKSWALLLLSLLVVLLLVVLAWSRWSSPRPEADPSAAQAADTSRPQAAGADQGVTAQIGAMDARIVALEDQVARLLAASDPLLDEPTRQKLRQPVIAQFDANSLENVIEYFRNAGNVDITVNWKALKTLGVDERSRVTLHLTNPQLGAALRAALNTLTVEPGVIDFEVVDGVIVISTADALRQAK